MSKKAEAINIAADHIRRVCPNDIGGQMLMAAFAQDSIDQRYPKEDNGPKREETDHPADGSDNDPT